MNEPIRILHIVTYMGRGGLETMLMNYYRTIDRSQVQFDFLVHRDFESAYDQEIQALGGRIYHVSRLVPWSNAYRQKLKNFFNDHPEYKIVHVHQDCLSSVALQCTKECDVPVRIAHSHNSSQDKNSKYLIKLFYRRFIPKYATNMMACSEAAGKWMFRGASFQILNNAIDAKQYQYNPVQAAQMRGKLGIPKESFVVGHVGRFSPQKNHKYLLDVFAEIQKCQKNAELLLVGDGKLRSEIEEEVSLLGLRDKVIMTGIRSDVPELLQAMDVFVFPSLYEGLPVTLVEAQAAGLPCFISDKVPLECKKTNLVTQISLQEPSEYWAEQILKAQGTERCNTYTEIAFAGFDIVENAKWLQNFYLAQWKVNE